MFNPVNRRCNRYFTEKEKIKILKLYYKKKLGVIEIAEELESLPNHITWCLMRWKPIQNLSNPGVQEEQIPTNC